MKNLTFLLLLTLSCGAYAKPLTPDQVPEPLKPWINWVKDKHTDLKCPVQYQHDQRQCIWPGELTLKVSKSGASFSQLVTIYRDSHFMLPGSAERWPANIKVNNIPAQVVEVNQLPTLWLKQGEYRITGDFTWSRIPDAVKINPQTGIVRYERNGEDVRHPQRRQGKLWLQSGQQSSAEKTPEDKVTMEVYRLVADGHPLQVTTELQLQVSGTQREMIIGTPITEGFIPLQIRSSLPARLEPDNKLRIQVRPGRWQIRITSRHPNPITELRMPQQESPWPKSEVWVYRASHTDRLTEIRNVTQIDPRQVRIPSDWNNLPTYQMMPNDQFQIHVVRRGDPDPEPDQLSIRRNIWLDFSGKGYTVKDHVTGKMTRDWRLSIDPALSLGRVTIDGKPQFITRLKENGREGVEVRRGQLDLIAESRVNSDTKQLPSTGWGRDMQKVNTTLHLPPGWQLLTASGVDNVPSSWIKRWTLYDLFIVLIATIAAGKLWGWKWTPLVLVTLALTWHEPNAPRMIWLYLLAGIALLRVAPADGKLHRVIKTAQRAGYLALLIIALPFMVNQAREGLYPQLEQRWASPQSVHRVAKTRHKVPAPAGAVEEARPDSIRKHAKEIAVSAPKQVMEFYSRGSVSKDLQQIDPKANIQTGPGLPSWKWKSAQLQYNGPVAADQKISLVLIGPTWHLLLNFLMIGLIAALAMRLVGLSIGKGKHQKLSQLMVLPLLLVPLSFVPTDTMAGDFPPPELLKELEQRLTEIPVPAPRASIGVMQIEASATQLTNRLQVDAIYPSAIPLPVDPKQTTPIRIQLDGKSAHANVYRSQQQQLWMLVPKGKHEINIEIRLPTANQVQIPLPLKPHKVTTNVTDWSIDGISPDGVPYQQIILTRIQRKQAASTEELSPTALPSFVKVQRTINFGLQWEVVTQVSRASLAGVPISVQIPVVPGASVITDRLQIKDGHVLVNLNANQHHFSWRSRLDPVETLTLTAPDNDSWIETWHANIGPVWNVTMDGIPPIHHQDAGSNWIPAWHPWPGEKLTFKVTRPQGVEGATLTIDKSELTVRPGKRATDSVLKFTLRASQGDKYAMTIPGDAQLQSAKINGRTQPIRQQGNAVTLPVVPGKQDYELTWREASGISKIWRTPSFGMPGKNVNASLVTHMPRDRWTLIVRGPELGPAVLFWGVLVVLILIAYALNQLGKNYLPLGFVSWLLLAVGLSQVTIFSGILVVGWFFFLYYRSQMTPETSRWKFNLAQIGSVFLTLASLSVLLWVVKQGLLGFPEMQIRGYGSNAYLFNWYQDHMSADYPEGLIISVPLLVYRLLMLAWALWLAFSLLKWLKWGWGAFSTNGIWRSKVARAIEEKRADDS